MRSSSTILRLVIAATLAVVLLPKPAVAGPGVGIKAGYLHSNLTFSNANEVFNGDSGWMAGVFFAGKNAIGGDLEVNFMKKRIKDAGTGVTTDLNYLDIPILIKGNIGSGRANGVSFYLMGGPAFDFKIGDSISSLAQVQRYETFDFSLVGAAGLELTRFLIEARGQWGLRNIAITQLTAGDLHSRSFAVLFGVRFN